MTGEFDRVVIQSDGHSDLLNREICLQYELPFRGVTELDRLSHLVFSVENDCQVVPAGSCKLTPIKELKRNEAFKGLKKDECLSLTKY